MHEPLFAWLALGLALVLAAARRREHAVSVKLAAEQRSALGQLAEEVTSLREALLSSGAVERPAKLPTAAPLPAKSPPPGPVPPLPSVKREVVTVTRDDDPAHTRPTVEAPSLLGEVHAAEEPPSTKPSRSREIPAPASPRSAPRPVSLEDQIVRAMKRIERQAKVPPEVEARWEQRLRALGAELGLREDAEPTDEQVEAMIRELYEAEADVKDAQPVVLPLRPEATLASAVSPIAVRIAQAASRSDDAEGEATLRREGDRPTTLPQAHVDDDSEDGRDTGEDMTKVFSKDPGAADAQIPGVGVKPATVHPPPHRPPRPLVDPLAGVEPERPTASATRTAETFRRRTTLHGISAPKDDQGGEA
jgi:hypothetical protein